MNWMENSGLKEVIFKEDLEKIFGKRPFDKVFDGKGQEVTKDKVIIEAEPPMNKEEEKENK